MPRLFGTAGIRGATNREITVDLALRVARVYGDHLGNRGRCVVGHDTRYGAQALAQAASAGLRSAGIDVTDCGCIPTGGIATILTQGGFDGGVLITGSHMPPDRIGIIVLLKDGAYIPDGVAEALEARLAKSETAPVPPDRIGSYAAADRPIARYIDDLLSHVDVSPIRTRGFHVVVDPANGTATLALQETLRRAGCRVTDLHAKAGPVPERQAEPRANVLGAIRKTVLEVKADIGMATDIDADRILFVDAAGQVLSEDCTGAIFAQRVLPGSKNHLCVCPINSSALIEQTCAAIGARVEFCRAGQPATVEAVKRLDADYAYEESGKYYFCREALWCDGLLAGLKMLDLLARENRTLAEVASEFPRFYQVKQTIHCDDSAKARIMARVRERWEKELLEGRARDLTIDGLKRSYADHAWLLVRASGTEPLIRVYADAPSAERAQSLVRDGEALLRASAKDVGAVLDDAG